MLSSFNKRKPRSITVKATVATSTIRLITKKESAMAETTKTKFYKKATFPWAIIVVSIALVCGLMWGWTLRGDNNAQVKAEAQNLVSTLKQND